MTHYEERLQRDLDHIRACVYRSGERVKKAVQASVQALLTLDKPLAYQTILGDLRINRDIREIDRLCHSFVARHLPSAGHLRFVSSVLRLNIELERIADYAAGICREAVQLRQAPSPGLARDIDLMADQSRRILAQALEAFHKASPELARGTMGMAGQAARTFDKVFQDLLETGEHRDRSLRDLFAFLVIFSRLNRVGAQAKNICEETVFATTGETKGSKAFRILFVDAENCVASQIAEALGRKAFPESGFYASQGWAPARKVDDAVVDFMNRNGCDMTGATPSKLISSLEELEEFHIIVGLEAEARAHIPEVPFHSIFLSWNVEKPAAGQQLTDTVLEELYRSIAVQLRDLIEQLRGEGAS